jgi:hypothetical protein
MSKKDPRIQKLGVDGYNKPKRTPNHPTKSHVVLAKVGDEIKTVRFGQQGVKGAGANPTTAKDKAPKEIILRDITRKTPTLPNLSARYWSRIRLSGVNRKLTWQR